MRLFGHRTYAHACDSACARRARARGTVAAVPLCINVIVRVLIVIGTPTNPGPVLLWHSHPILWFVPLIIWRVESDRACIALSADLHRRDSGRTMGQTRRSSPLAQRRVAVHPYWFARHRSSAFDASMPPTARAHRLRCLPLDLWMTNPPMAAHEAVL